MLVLTDWPFPVSLNYKNTQFILDIVTPDQPILPILELRHDIFCTELNYFSESSKSNLEQDVYDAICDHLVIRDMQQNSVVASYRLLRHELANQHGGFVSEQEFDLTTLKQHLKMLETGRACVHKNYRHRFLISLLWKGLIHYMNYYGFDYIGGCTSIVANNVDLAKLVYSYAKSQNALTPSYLNIKPHSKNKVIHFSPDYLLTDVMQAKRQLPSLLRGYLKIGAKLSHEPALDLEWNVIDFFTLFHKENINKKIDHFLDN